MKLAAVTMVYNEAEYLPVWLRHYGAAVGIGHCHVVDHGSSDGSTAQLHGANRLRLPRSPHDDARRAAFMSDYCASLLHWYDAVIYTDVDELVVADPAYSASLGAYAGAMTGDVATAIGVNVLHLAGEEAALDFGRAVLSQRRFGWFSSAMCKPVLIRRPVRWAPGFHSADAAVAFGGLFLFHLRYADRATAMARLARTRAMDWADLAAGGHQRVGDTEFAAMLEGLERMDRRDDVAFEAGVAPLAEWLARVEGSQAGREGEAFRIALDVECYELWRIPERFVGDDGGGYTRPCGRI